MGIQSQLIDLIEVCAQGTENEDSVNDSMSLLKDLLVEEILENNSTQGSFIITLQQKPNRKLLPD